MLRMSLLIIAVVLAPALASVPAAWAGSGYKTLYKFPAHPYAPPTGGLIFDKAGNIYGTTYLGGDADDGTVFKLMRRHGIWERTVLYSFCSLAVCSDGADPIGGVILDSSGNLYGTTAGGGAYDMGTVFRLTPHHDGSWSESVLHSFEGGADGREPWAGLVFDQEGRLYGTTAAGGGSSACYQNYGCGVVFQLSPGKGEKWNEAVLYSFKGTDGDGSNPIAGLILDQEGNLYGTTQTGGRCRVDNQGCGIAFEVLPSGDGGWNEKILYSFGDNGILPSAGLTLDAFGNLYGATVDSLTGCATGVVFELTPNANGTWTEAVLHEFCSHDGEDPFAGVILDSAGNLYGTAAFGGDFRQCTYGCGVVFELKRNSDGRWHESVLHYFADHPGDVPYGVIFDATGNLYGGTQGDGTTTFGSVFEITP